MKNRIKFVLIILFIAIFAVLLYISKSNKNSSNNGTEFKNYQDEYIAPKVKYECNEFSIINISTNELVQMYFNKYINNALQDIEQVYNLLNIEYREKKFGNIEEYKKYVENNKEMIIGNKLASYQTQKNGDNTRYICIDKNGKYYIFDETAIMEFTVILDAYTLDLPEFIEKYTSATEQQKVALNIEKFMQAINDKSYYYAYNCLADSYKNNYFKTQEEFENYVKENFYSNNTVGYNQFSQEGEVYTYSVVLTNKETGEQMNKTFIVKLEEGTDFVLSFNK